MLICAMPRVSRPISRHEEDEDPAFYMGRYVTLAELKPKNLRAIHGWKMPDYAA